MALVVLLKFFHYLALFLAGGLGVGAAIIQTAHRKAGTAPAPTVQTAMHMLARLGLVSIIILWGTGIWLAYSIYGGMGIGWAFHIKLLGATGLLLAIIGLNLHLARIAKSGSGMPNPRLVRVVQMTSRGSLVLVLAGIAITTTL